MNWPALVLALLGLVALLLATGVLGVSLEVTEDWRRKSPLEKLKGVCVSLRIR